MDVLRRLQDLINRCSIADHSPDALEGLDRHVIHPLVLRCGRHANSERAQDLPGVAVVVRADLGNQHIALFEQAV